MRGDLATARPLGVARTVAAYHFRYSGGMGLAKTMIVDAQSEPRVRGGASVRRASTVRARRRASQEGEMTKLKDVRSKSPEDGFSAEPSASPDVEHALAEAIAKARGRAGLTQEEVAQRMQTTQSNIARLEAGRTIPSTRTLKKFAAAIGARLKITFERTGR